MKNRCRTCKKIIPIDEYRYWSNAWDEEKIQCSECLRSFRNNEHDIEQDIFRHDVRGV